MAGENETLRASTKTARYDSLLRATLAALGNSSADTRIVVYERARKAMRNALEGRQQSAAEVEREQSALEEAIRRVEREAQPSVSAPDEEAPRVESKGGQGSKRGPGIADHGKRWKITRQIGARRRRDCSKSPSSRTGGRGGSA